MAAFAHLHISSMERSVRCYAVLLARSARRRTHESPCPATDDWSWWSAWSAAERAHFFRALARHSRWRPDAIAAEVGKPVEEVARTIRRFDRQVRRVEGLEKRVGRRRTYKARLSQAPAAREMSASWLAQEEQCAAALVRGADRIASAHAGPAQASAAADFLRCEKAEGIWTALSRMLVLPSRPSWPATLEPTEAYRAYAHVQSVPILSTPEQVAGLVNDLLEARLLAFSQPTSPITPEVLLKNGKVQWLEADPRVPAWLDLPALALRMARTRRTSYLGMDTARALARHVEAFLYHTLYELTIVGERTLRLGAIDEQHVWACAARLGYPVYATHHDDERPRLDAGLLHSVAVARACADPPVAWREEAQKVGTNIVHPDVLDDDQSEKDYEDGQYEPLDASGTEHRADHAETHDREATTADQVYEDTHARETFHEPGHTPEGRDNGAMEDAGHAPDDTQAEAGQGPAFVVAEASDRLSPIPLAAPTIPTLTEGWRIGALAPLCPYEYVQENAEDAESPDAPDSDEAHSDVDADEDADVDEDADIDQLDRTADAHYERRLVRDWFYS